MPVMMRAAAAGIPLRLGHLVLTTAILTHLSDGACTLDAPTDAWEPRVAYEAAHIGKPDVSIPLIGAGFNRTLNLDGFCNDVLYTSEDFDCKRNAAGEFLAMVKSPTGAFLRFDGANCPLAGISVAKTPGAQFEAQIRFQFERCAAATGFPVPAIGDGSAAVVVGLRKELGSTQQSNLFPWMQEVCKVQTTTPAQAALVVKTKDVMFAVGNGTCNGDTPKYVEASTQAACKALCYGSILDAEATGKKDGVCSGFAFSSKAPKLKQCILYTGKVTESTANKLPGRRLAGTAQLDWQCFNLTIGPQDYKKTTAPPSPVQALQELTQNLHIREVMAGAPASMTTAKLMQVSPKKGEEGCFKSSWWFMMQDGTGTMASIPVMEADWNQLMDMLPKPEPITKPVDSSIVIDRVLVKTCNPNKVSWGRECVMPTVKTVCERRQIITSVITAVVVPVVGWLLVYVVYKLLAGGAKDDCDDLRPGADSDAPTPKCTPQMLVTLCIAAVLACAILAAMVTSLIGLILGSAGCLHGPREMLVIGCATAIPTALAMIIGLLYLARSAKEVDAREQKVEKNEPQKYSKLMLLEVQDGESFGTIINPDVMTTGTNATRSVRMPRIEVQ